MVLKCCYPQSSFCGYLGLIKGAKILALVDIFINLSVLVFILVSRTFIEDPPSAFKTIFWFLMLIAMDVLLFHGLRSSRLVPLVIWQTVFLFHLILLSTALLIFLVFGLPNFEFFLKSIMKYGKDDLMLRITIIIIFSILVLQVPFIVYLFRIINGIKNVYRQISLEQLATRASQRILVRGQNQNRAFFLDPPSKKKEECDRQWIHQDISVYTVDADSQEVGVGSQDFPTMPIYENAHQDPMQPFMPAYSPQPRLDMLHRMDSTGSTVSSASSSALSVSVSSTSGFILPKRTRTVTEVSQ